MSDPKNDSNGVTKRELASSVLLKEVDLEPFLELLQGGELRNLEEGEVLIEVRESNRTYLFDPLRSFNHSTST